MAEPSPTPPPSEPAASAAGVLRRRTSGANGERSLAGPPPRPRPSVAPPPDPAEALYYEGMAAYQHRDWARALDRFTRLRDLQPHRPGLQALLDEVNWFLQLESTGPETLADATASAPLAAVRPNSQSPARPPMSRLQSAAIILIGLIGIAALIITVAGGRLPWNNSTTREAQELYNRGQARLAAGDYEGAQAAFRRLLEIAPNDPEAALGLTRAERQQILAQGYAAAEAAIAAEEWDAAAAELQRILALDPAYADAQAKADFVARRRRLASLYNDGSRLYDLGQWESAIAQFEKIRELDATYRAEAVTEFLFISYLNAGQTLIERAGGQVGPVQRAVEYFSTALAIHPRNRQAADARRLAALYLDAVRAQANQSLAEAQSRLEALLAEAPTYANGAAAQQLYNLLLARGAAAIAAGDIPAAIRFYQAAQNVPVSDRQAAVQGEALARAITPTPTPTPTSLPTPTSPPATPTPFAVAREGTLNLRAGPGLNFAIIGQAAPGDRLALLGRSADGLWLQVCCVAGQTGWVATALAEVIGSTEGLIVVAAPTATAIPSPTPVRLTCIAGQVRNAGDGSPLAGWTISLSQPGSAAQTTRSDASGFYRFADLAAGTYTVAEQMEPGWRPISPQSSVVIVAPALACVTVDFWNERISAPAEPATPPPTAPPPTPTPRR